MKHYRIINRDEYDEFMNELTPKERREFQKEIRRRIEDQLTQRKTMHKPQRKRQN